MVDPAAPDFQLVRFLRSFDREHVRQVFINARSGPNNSYYMHEDRSTSEPAPVSIQLSDADELLIEKLAEENTFRRRRLRGAERRDLKATLETDRVLQQSLDPQRNLNGAVSALNLEQNAENATNPLSQPTTASRVLTMLEISFDDSKSYGSRQTTSIASKKVVDGEVRIPDPPKIRPEDKHAMCPYCCFICPRREFGKSEWRWVAYGKPKINLMMAESIFCEFSNRTSARMWIAKNVISFWTVERIGKAMRNGFILGPGSAKRTRMLFSTTGTTTDYIGKSIIILLCCYPTTNWMRTSIFPRNRTGSVQCASKKKSQ